MRSLYHDGWKQPPPPPCISSRARRASASPRSGDDRIGFQCRRRGEPLGPHDAVHAEGRDRITAVAFERDEERVRSLLGGRVDDQIRALPRPQQKTPDRFVSSQGLPVQSDDPALQPVQLQHEDARVGGVRQPQPEPLVTPNLAPPAARAVDRHPIAETPPVRAVAHGAEALVDLRLRREAPIVDEQEFVPIDLGPAVGVLDDQRSVKTSSQLLPSPIVGVVPIGPGVGRHEIVEEAPAGWHRRLRQFRHAVHGILDSDAMPVHGGRLRQLVDEPTPDALSLPDADDRTRHPPLITPDRCRRIVGRDELCRSRPRLQRWRVGAGRRSEEWEAAGRRHADEPARKCPSGNAHRHLQFGLSSPQLVRIQGRGHGV